MPPTKILDRKTFFEMTCKSTPMTYRRLVFLLQGITFLCVAYSYSGAVSAQSGKGSAQAPLVFRMASIFNAVPGVNTEDSRLSLEMLMRNISMLRGNPFSIQLDFLMEFDQAADKIIKDQYDLVVLPGLDYLQIRSKVDLIPRMVLSPVDKPTEPLILVTQRSETLSSLARKKSRILIIDVGRTGQSAKLWLDTMLIDAGYGTCNQFFTEIRFSQKPNRSVLPVFFGQVSACAVTESALKVASELNPQVERRVKILKRSENLVNLMLCATPWAEREKVDILVAEGMQAIVDPKFKQALTMVQMNRFYIFEPKYIADSEKLYRRFKHNMKKIKAKKNMSP